MIAATMVNLWSKKGGKRARPSDFMPKYGIRKPKPPTPDEWLGRLKQMNAVLGGEYVDSRGRDD